MNPSEDPAPATPDDDAILESFLDRVSARGIELYPAQEEAVLELYAGRHVILNTPTGSGKSMVALAMQHRALALGRRCFYTSPIKALVNEKFFDLCREFGPENVGMMTGDASVNPDANLVCCTAEVLAKLALRGWEQAPVDDVVMDEFHYFADPERGMAWQIPLVTLPQATFLLMSATLGDVSEFERRIEARTGRAVAVVRNRDRPVPLEFVYATTSLQETVQDLVEQVKAPIYLVSFTQRECFEVAQALTSAQVASKEQRRELAEAIRDVRFGTPAGRPIRRALMHGIGIHHGGLLPRYRRLAERLAQAGKLQVICGTDTLGVGINVPIRTVLFAKLCKYDGARTRIVRVRDFHQIAGRAGRKGFDVRGTVVAQAPAHVVENLRLERKAGDDPKKRRKIVRKKPPERGYVHWDEDTFRRLVDGDPEPLSSRFGLDHGVMVDCLDREVAHGRRDGGYRRVLELIARSYERQSLHGRHRRHAARLFRSLRDAGVVELARVPWSVGPAVRVAPGMRRELSMFHSLSLYLMQVLEVVDPKAPDHALTVLSLVEAILETPQVVLRAQERALKDALVAQLKADGVEYEARMEKLQEVRPPAPCAELVEETFEVFRRTHPWLGGDRVRPKSIAREMFEGLLTFNQYVGQLGLARAEGVLFRYLGQVVKVLERIVPPRHETDGVLDIVAYLRVMLERVDDSIVREWSALTGGGGDEAPDAEPPADPEVARRARLARIRAGMHRLVQAIAAGEYEEAVAGLEDVAGAPWRADALEDAMAPYLAEHGEVVWGHAARFHHLTEVEEDASGRTWARQTLVGPDGPTDWVLEAEILAADVDAPLQMAFHGPRT